MYKRQVQDHAVDLSWKLQKLTLHGFLKPMDSSDTICNRDHGADIREDVYKRQAPYYAIKIAPGIHHTMGGVKIDTSAEVIDKEGNVIPGLFAAGEVTGGIHGANRIGGNAVCDIVVFGKIASDSAVKYCNGETIEEVEEETEAAA